MPHQVSGHNVGKEAPLPSEPMARLYERPLLAKMGKLPVIAAATTISGDTD